MTDMDKHTLVVERHRLHTEFAHLRRKLEEYRGFLATTNGAAGWPAQAVPLLRDQHLALLQARVSLGTVELTCALLREVLSRVGLSELHFRVRPGAERPPGQPSPPAPSSMGALVASLAEATRTAPLEQQDKLQRLLAGIVELFGALGEAGSERVEAALARINMATANAQSRNLLREIAIVTRDIYSALRSVSEELPLDQLSESSGGISEAVQRLNSVVVRLDEAASQNLDHLEQVNRIAEEEGAALAGVVGALRTSQHRLMEIKAGHPALEDALTRVQQRLSDEVGAPAMTLRHDLQRAGAHHLQLMSNQSFQELTGRTLKKVIDFVQSLETQLYDILRQHRPAADAPAPPDTAPAAPEPESAGEPTGQQQSQDDVDKLLGELGF